MDRYGHQVHTKGGFVNFKPRYIIFTSNKEPSQWYPKVSVNQQMWPAFQNRVHVQIKFVKHSIGVQLQWQKGSVDEIPEGVPVPRSTNPPMVLNRAPKLAPKIQPKRNMPPVVRRVQTSSGYVDQPITIDPFLADNENHPANNQ
nr:putative replication initiation protein [Fiddler Crab associated circular virus]